MGEKAYSLPYATSLRMSDLGHTTHEQEKRNVSYDDLSSYVTSLQRASQHTSQSFEAIGFSMRSKESN